MNWYMAIGCGAGGGAIVEAIVFWGKVSAWQEARHRGKALKTTLPPLHDFFDAPSDLLAALTRLALGAAADWVFYSQVTGVYAAVAVGASAPALLRQIGRAQSLVEALRPPQESQAELDKPSAGSVHPENGRRLPRRGHARNSEAQAGPGRRPPRSSHTETAGLESE